MLPLSVRLGPLRGPIFSRSQDALYSRLVDLAQQIQVFKNLGHVREGRLAHLAGIAFFMKKGLVDENLAANATNLDGNLYSLAAELH